MFEICLKWALRIIRGLIVLLTNKQFGESSPSIILVKKDHVDPGVVIHSLSASNLRPSDAVPPAAKT